MHPAGNSPLAVSSHACLSTITLRDAGDIRKLDELLAAFMVQDATRQPGFIGAQRFLEMLPPRETRNDTDRQDSSSPHRTCILATFWETAGASTGGLHFDQYMEQVGR